MTICREMLGLCSVVGPGQEDQCTGSLHMLVEVKYFLYFSKFRKLSVRI